MGIYIKGMEMPKVGNWKTIRIYPDGTCAVPNWQGDCTLIQGAQAVPVPPHGRLIDSEAMKESIQCTDTDEQKVLSTKELHRVLNGWIDHRPTIIEAEEGE